MSIKCTVCGKELNKNNCFVVGHKWELCDKHAAIILSSIPESAIAPLVQVLQAENWAAGNWPKESK